MERFVLALLLSMNVGAVALAAAHDCDTWTAWSGSCSCCRKPVYKCEEGTNENGGTTKICGIVCEEPGTGARAYDICSHGKVRNDTGCVKCS